MSHIVSTYFDSESWQKSGVNWLRKAKSAGLTGFVVGRGLSAEAEQKAKDLGFRVIPISDKYGDDRALYHSLVGAIQKGQRCLFIKHTVPIKTKLEANGVACDLDKTVGATEIVASIKRLTDRAKTIKVIREKVEGVYNGTLSPNWILGSWEFWNAFLAFQNYLHEKDFLDRQFMYHELVFNLYIALAASVTLEVSHDD